MLNQEFIYLTKKAKPESIGELRQHVVPDDLLDTMNILLVLIPSYSDNRLHWSLTLVLNFNLREFVILCINLLFLI